MRNFLLSILMLIPVSALAHGGHDHSHWTSSAVHMILALAIVGVTAVVGTLLVKKIMSKSVEVEK